jgi:choline kinase
MTTALILSAGQGSRLAPHTNETPKCLLEFHGRSLLEWQIDALADVGVERVCVVVGYRADKVAARIARRTDPRVAVELLHNPFFRVAENISSVWLAREYLRNDPALLLNGDTLVPPPLIAQAIDGARHPVNVTVDIKSSYDDDDMKVTLQDGLVTDISKKLPPSQTDAESIGLLVFKGNGGALFGRTLSEMIEAENGIASYYLAAVARLAAAGQVGATSIAGHRWAEVDFPADLDRAASLTRRWTSQRWAQGAGSVVSLSAARKSATSAAL